MIMEHNIIYLSVLLLLVSSIKILLVFTVIMVIPLLMIVDLLSILVAVTPT